MAENKTLEEKELAKQERAELAQESFKEDAVVTEEVVTEEAAEEFIKESDDWDAFLRRSVVVPGKKVRNKVFKDEVVIKGIGADKIVTPGAAREREFAILSSSAKAEKFKPLYGRVIGVEVMEFGGKDIPFAVCTLGAEDITDMGTANEINTQEYKVMIPAPMFFNYSEEVGEDIEKLKKNMVLRIGSIAEFVVYDINAAECKVLASRLRAMQVLSYDWYLKGGSNARVKIGDIVAGHITCVNSAGIYIDAMGVETFVSNTDLAWRFIRNATEEFHVGDWIQMKLLNFKKETKKLYNMTYPYISAKASVKDAYKRPNETHFDRYELGQKYAGVISYRFETGNYLVELRTPGRNSGGRDFPVVICKPPYIEYVGTPHAGQECQVAITFKNEDTHTMTGAITYLKEDGLY